METQIQKQLHRLERQRNELAGRLSGWSAERLRRRPSPQVWSALDIVDHLVRVDSGILGAIRGNLVRPTVISVRDQIRGLIVNAVMLSPLRVKVPASATSALPQNAESLPELLARWEETSRAFANLAANVTAEQHSSGVFCHPVAGWMSFNGALRFVSAHLRHHTYQLRRLERAAR